MSRIDCELLTLSIKIDRNLNFSNRRKSVCKKIVEKHVKRPGFFRRISSKPNIKKVLLNK